MLSADVQAAITTVIEQALAPIAVLGVQFGERQTYDGDHVIDVTVLLPSNTGPLPPQNYMEAMTNASQTLLSVRDERMPLFRTRREGEPETAEEETVAEP